MKPPAISAAARRLNTVITLCLVVIFVGAYVRISEAGLACPDWPLCHGELLPNFSAPVFWEWLHRLLALLTFIYVVYFAYSMWHTRQRLALAIMLIVFVGQALLGALTVTELLNPRIVNLHFLNALLLLSFFVWFKLKLRLQDIDPHKLALWQLPRRGHYTMMLLTGLVLLQLGLGTVVAANYGGYACPALLTCTGSWEWPRIAVQTWHMLHRVLALVLLGVTIYLCRMARRQILLPPLTRLSWQGSAWLVAIQAVLGLVTVATGLSASLRLLHFVLGVVLYLLLCAASCEYLLLWRKQRRLLPC